MILIATSNGKMGVVKSTVTTQLAVTLIDRSYKEYLIFISLVQVSPTYFKQMEYGLQFLQMINDVN